MNYDVQYTESFRRELKYLAKKYRSLKADLLRLIETLEVYPAEGTPIGQNCYKIRLAITSKAKGKSGGARVITNIFVDRHIVYLLTIYDKSEKEYLSEKELNDLLKNLT